MELVHLGRPTTWSTICLGYSVLLTSGCCVGTPSLSLLILSRVPAGRPSFLGLPTGLLILGGRSGAKRCFLVLPFGRPGRLFIGVPSALSVAGALILGAACSCCCCCCC